MCMCRFFLFYIYIYIFTLSGELCDLWPIMGVVAGV